MGVLPWRPRVAGLDFDRKSRRPGEYAGRARFVPQYPELLPPELQKAVGQVVEVAFAGVAPPDGTFAGQDLYLEWRRDEMFDGFQIPGRDLEFIHE